MTLSWRFGAAVSAGLVLFGACTSSDGLPQAPVATDPSTETTGADAPVLIRRTDFQVKLEFDGVSQDSSAVGLLSNPLLALEPRLPSETPVRRGQRIGNAVVAPDVETALERAPANTADAAELEQLRSLEGRVLSPVDGVLRLGGDVPQVQASGLDVVAPLTPIQALRYQALRFTGRAKIETVLGQRDSNCEALWIERTPSAMPGAGGGELSASSLHCRLPRYIETTAGLRARVRVESERLEDVVVVPNFYVGNDAETGKYFIRVSQGGDAMRINVVVGVTDGVVRVIRSDVPVGATLVPLEAG